MANDLTANPWYIDTTGFIWQGRVYINDLIWSNATPGDALVITDINGNFIVNTVANAGTETFYFGKMGWVTGLVVVTLTGNLSVFINK